MNPNWPTVTVNAGIIDLTGVPKSRVYYVDSSANIIEIFGSEKDEDREITLIFLGVAEQDGIERGNNLYLETQTFPYRPNDTLTLIGNGAFWWELGRMQKV